MELFIKDNGRIRRDMGMEYSIGQWDLGTKENGKMIGFMAMEHLNM